MFCNLIGLKNGSYDQLSEVNPDLTTLTLSIEVKVKSDVKKLPDQMCFSTLITNPSNCLCITSICQAGDS